MEQNQSSLLSLNVDAVTTVHLTGAAKWARFLAILGIIFLLLMVISSVFGVSMWSNVFRYSARYNDVDAENLSNSLRIGMIIYILVVALIMFFPLLFLLRFANAALTALRSADQNRLNFAMQNLKAYFRYLGILAIIFLSLMLLSILFGVAVFSTYTSH